MSTHTETLFLEDVNKCLFTPGREQAIDQIIDTAKVLICWEAINFIGNMVEEFLTGTEMAKGSCITKDNSKKKKKTWCTLHPLQVLQWAENVSFSVGVSLF